MKSVDIYYTRQYVRHKYNCSHFAAEVWKDLTGIDISGPIAGMYAGKRFDRSELRLTEKLVDPCIVMFRAPRLGAHCGIYLRKKVLHLLPTGVQFQPLVVVGFNFPIQRFYVCR